MQEKINCCNCETVFTLKWIPLDLDEDDPDEIGLPLFCPFCGAELESEGDEEDEE
jgi:hypothetical protein